MNDGPYLSVQGLRRTYDTHGVHGISFSAPEGQLVTLLGPSGCGKTTTLRCLAGIETPDDGEISFGGRTVFSAARRIQVPPERRDVGMVFQSYALWPHMTVRENVAFPLLARHYPKAEVATRVRDLLSLVGLADYADRPATQLSGGQQQRVSLARALVYEPRLLLFDEPLSNLDAQLRESMRRDIRQLQQKLGITAVYVTHDRAEALAISDTTVVMAEGRILQAGHPNELFRWPASRFVASLLGDADFLPGTIVDWSASGSPREVTVELRLSHGTAHIRARMADGLDVRRGMAVTVCLRPARVRIVKPAAERSSSLGMTGTVTDVATTGTAFEYGVDVGGAMVRVVSLDELGVAPGERVAVLPDEAHTHCLVD